MVEKVWCGGVGLVWWLSFVMVEVWFGGGLVWWRRFGMVYEFWYGG